MDCDFPWSTELFEAENVSSFNEAIDVDTAKPPLPTLRKAAESLLQMPNSSNRVPWDCSLSAEHFLLLIYGMQPFPHDVMYADLRILIYVAMNSLAFQARSGLLGFISMDTIKRAAMKWKKLWKTVLSRLKPIETTTTKSTTTTNAYQNLHLGYPKHAEELWWLLMATLEIESQCNGKSFQYLDSTATDDLGKLNEFIQFALPRKSIT